MNKRKTYINKNEPIEFYSVCILATNTKVNTLHLMYHTFKHLKIL